MLWLRSHFYSGVSGASGRNPFYGGERSSRALDNIRIGNDVVIEDVFHVRRTRTGGPVRSRGRSVTCWFGLAHNEGVTSGWRRETTKTQNWRAELNLMTMKIPAGLAAGARAVRMTEGCAEAESLECTPLEEFPRDSD